MTTKNAYVPLWLTYGTYFESYNDEQVGRLARAMMEYRRTGTPPQFAGSERYIWPAIQRDIDNLTRTLQERSEQNRQNGAKGGRPKKGAVSGESRRASEEPKKGNETVIANGKDMETVSEKDSETVKKKKNDFPSQTAEACLPSLPAQKPQTQKKTQAARDAILQEKILKKLGKYFTENCGQNQTAMLIEAFRRSLEDGATEELLRVVVDDTAALMPDKPVFYVCRLLESLRGEQVRDADAFRSRKETFRQRNAGLKRDQVFDYTSEEGSL